MMIDASVGTAVPFVIYLEIFSNYWSQL